MNFKQIIDVNGSTSQKEISLLMDYAGKVPDNGIIVDVGTAGGRSALALTMGSKPSVKVYTIDISLSEKLKNLIKQSKLEDKLFQLTIGSEEVCKTWEKPIDLFFQDAVHEYDFMKKEIKRWLPYLDGDILFHDYKLYEDAVGKAIDESVEEGLIKKIEVIDNLFIAKRGDKNG